MPTSLNMMILRLATGLPDVSIAPGQAGLEPPPNHIPKGQIMLNWLRNKAPRRRKGRSGPPDAGRCGLIDAQQSGWYRKKDGELIKGFKIVAEDTLLDAGCGDGPACRFAANQGAEVIAADCDPRKIEAVKSKLQKTRARAFQAIVTDSNPLPLPDKTASKVVAMEVIEHVNDPARFLAELVRVGNDGAQYLITAPDPVGESIQRVVAPPAYWSPPNHLRIFQRDELDLLVEEAGLKIERRTRYSFYWSMWWILFWAADQEFGEPEAPLLENWTKTWYELITSPKGKHIKEALDDFMPKSQVIIARKAA